MLKRILALVLCAALCLCLLAACADNNSTPSTNNDQTNTNNQTSTESKAPDELVTINFYRRVSKSLDDETAKRIDAAVNAITEKEIGVHVNTTYMDGGTYRSQLPLILQGGETVDLCFIHGEATSLSAMTSNGMLMDITDLLNSHGQGILDAVGTYLDSCKVGGKIYAVPNYRDYAAAMCIIAREDILEELGMLDDFNNMKSWSDYEKILAAVTEKYASTGMYGIGGQAQVLPNYKFNAFWTGDSFDSLVTFDKLGDGLGVIYSDPNGSGKVSSLFDQDLTYTYELATDWYNKGYVFPDVAITDVLNYDQMRLGLIFSIIVNAEVDAAVNWSSNTEHPCVSFNTGGLMLGSSTVNGFGSCIPVNAEEPEAAMKFLNLCYTNKELANLVTWGEEGVDYVVKDGEACYPNGDSSVGYHQSDWVFGNYFLCLPWEGTGADFREVALADLKAAPVSPYLGMNLDVSELSNEIAAITAVLQEYSGQYCGFYDETEWAAMKTKLEAAGIYTYVDAAQKQLDAWLASK